MVEIKVPGIQLCRRIWAPLPTDVLSRFSDRAQKNSESSAIESSSLRTPDNNNINCTVKQRHSQSPSISHFNIISNPLQLDPVDSEIETLRQGVSRLQRGKQLLTDYATELQSRIRQLEQDHMDSQPSAKKTGTTSSVSRLPTIISSASASASSKSSHPLTRPSLSSLSSSRPSSNSPSLSSTTPKTILSQSTGQGHLLAPGVKSKLLPKRVIRHGSGISVPSEKKEKSHSNLSRPMSPSRPSTTILAPSKSKNLEKKSDVQSKNSSNNTSKLPLPGSHSNKRTLFSPKLDSLVLTSKLLPVSSRVKTSTKTSESPTISILPPSPATIVTAACAEDAVILDSPPSKGTIKSRHIITIEQGLPNPSDKGAAAQAERSAASEDTKTSLHVSFSNSINELGGKQPEGSSRKSPNIESTSKLWGSWNKKRTSLQVPTIPEDPDSSSVSPSIQSTDDGKQKEKHRSLAPQYLRSLMSGSNESMSAGPHIALRRTSSMSGHPNISISSEPHTVHPDVGSSSSTKRRLSPMLVGSPTLPKARLESEADVERVSSLRSSGKWANRSRILSVDLTRRRTVHPAHPMFSFERPGSAGAASAKDGKQIEIMEAYDVKKQRRSTMPAKPTGSPTPGSIPGQANIDGPPQSDPGAAPSKGRLLRPLLGGQTLGRFDFEASTSTSILPRRPERASRFSSSTAPIKPSSSTIRLSKLGVPGSTDALSSSTKDESQDDKRFREYTAFCKDLRSMLGDDDWSSFMNYARRFDLHVLTPDVLLQRVKNLIDGRRNVDLATKSKIYERFSKIVHDSIRD